MVKLSMNNIFKYENKQDLLNNNKSFEQIVVVDYCIAVCKNASTFT